MPRKTGVARHQGAAGRDCPVAERAFNVARKNNAALVVEYLFALAETYVRVGYELVELPRAPVAERLQFVVNTAQANPAS